MTENTETATARLAKDNGYDAEVVHPGHYTSGLFGSIECWDFAGLHSYHVGNAIKYIWRHAHKGKPEQDLRKALQYLGRARRSREVTVLPGQTDVVDGLRYEICEAIDRQNLPSVYRAIYEASHGSLSDAEVRIAAWIEDVLDHIEPIAANERPKYVSGGVLDLVGQVVTVPGTLLRSNVSVIATGQLARIEAHRSGAAEYTLVGEGSAAVPTRVLVQTGAIVEPGQ